MKNFDKRKMEIAFINMASISSDCAKSVRKWGEAYQKFEENVDNLINIYLGRIDCDKCPAHDICTDGHMSCAEAFRAWVLAGAED